AHEHELADRHVATDLFAALPQQCFMECLAIVLTAARQNEVGASGVTACDGQQAAIANDDRLGGIADGCHSSTIPSLTGQSFDRSLITAPGRYRPSRGPPSRARQGRFWPSPSMRCVAAGQSVCGLSRPPHPLFRRYV